MICVAGLRHQRNTKRTLVSNLIWTTRYYMEPSPEVQGFLQLDRMSSDCIFGGGAPRHCNESSSGNRSRCIHGRRLLWSSFAHSLHWPLCLVGPVECSCIHHGSSVLVLRFFKFYEQWLCFSFFFFRFSFYSCWRIIHGCESASRSRQFSLGTDF